MRACLLVERARILIEATPPPAGVQLPDLLHIIDDAGMPSPTNVFIFNGDFVDRGPLGVEVMITLFALYLGCEEGSMYLNRGNHEDGSICAVYGFQGECRRKYDDMVFHMFIEVFKYLPIASILGETVRGAAAAAQRVIRSVALYDA